ncbi:hypothetical protein HYU07_05100 [Candidatus Woesearchaeota archaeon]|nr:hypothetical protein [Candidatus Woesearchaeota archaeon]
MKKTCFLVIKIRKVYKPPFFIGIYLIVRTVGGIMNGSIEELISKSATSQVEVKNEIWKSGLRQVSDWDEKFNLFFYGFGEVAKYSLVYMSANYERFCDRINEVYIYDTGHIDVEHIKRQIRKLKVNPYFGKEQIEYKLKTKDQFNIFFLTAKKREREDRYDAAEDNEILIDEIAPLFSEDYKGVVCIVTNLPEILSYKLALKSKLKPEQIFGFAHVDKFRLDKKIDEFLKDKYGYTFFTSTAFFKGVHARPRCIFNGAKVFYKDEEGLKDEFLKNLFDESELEEIRQQVNKKPKELYNLATKIGTSPTALETGEAISELIYNIIMNTHLVVNVDLPFKYSGFPQMYIELPAYFDKGKPLILTDLLKNLTDEDKMEVNESLEKLNEQNTNRFGCIGLEELDIGNLESGETFDTTFYILKQKYFDQKQEKDKGAFHILKQKYFQITKKDNAIFQTIKQKYFDQKQEKDTTIEN